ncbi:MAG: MarR family transcriptional regulator [Sulfolobales archaeon]
MRERSSIKDKILRIIEEAGPRGVSQREIVYITGSSKGYVSDVIDELERRGLVIRYRGPGRIVFVRHAKYVHPLTGRRIRIGFVRASEYIFMPDMIEGLKDLGFTTEVVLFDNVFDVARSISRGEIHMGMIPIYTQIGYRAYGAPIKMIPGGALGGGFLASLEDVEDIASKHDKVIIATSPLSTMEILSHSIMRSMRISYEIGYYKNPREVIEKLSSGSAHAASLWEPYASESSRALKNIKIRSYREILGEYHCCTLAVHENLVQGLYDEILKIYIESLERSRKNMDRAVERYSNMINTDINVLRKSVREYEYRDYIDPKIIGRIIRMGGGYMISEDILRDLMIS